MGNDLRQPVFLSAEWRNLVTLNYKCSTAELLPLVPIGTELDLYDGRAYLSLVGFEFRETRVRGFIIPGHRNFEEVNLRFYVRRRTEGGWRRGVVFIKELVPRRAIAWTARFCFNENYRCVPMSHAVEKIRGELQISYHWKQGTDRYAMTATCLAAGRRPDPDSLAAFITEHYWGYVRQRDGSTLEYEVQHPPWQVAAVSAGKATGDMAALYGPQFAPALASTPVAFVADGSAVQVHAGSRVL